MSDFFSLTLSEMQAWFLSAGEPAFRAKQLFDWVYRKSELNLSKMSNISDGCKQKLSAAFALPGIGLKRFTWSDDKETVKFLWELSDGRLVESVLIYSGARRTLCVSSQVGCPARCAFCASGKKGLLRNLSTSEIVEQVAQVNHWLADKGEKISHIVFMGMGEPLCNLEAVVKAIRILTDGDSFGLSQRRITVSTVGIVEGIYALMQEQFKVSLVLSLHAPNQHVRKKIIPYARKYEIEEIIRAVEEYARVTKRDPTYEYILIKDFNDRVEHARELAALLKGKQCSVNLIPYNPVDGLKFERPSLTEVNAFRKVLDSANIVNTCRYTKGDDIAAACGQLVMHEENLQNEATGSE
ncbi:MAG: 23S rRNA (adenine(2503)-C(2))-methyltransferase RlmN [Chlamydiia bacterium]|nr:23S rRNA (adenine(2503)-C(2))-methyltransferase RlmN [Chlamydiia bacterium]